jgi:lysophospholipase L1-like esterase
MIRILVLTDSVSLPRKYKDGSVSFESTYPYQLQKMYEGRAVFYFFQMGGATIKDLTKQINYCKCFKPDFLILQVGIVDCAPRAFSRLEMDLIKKWRLFRFAKPLTSYFRKYRNLCYTSKINFEKNLVKLFDVLQVRKIYGISILPSSNEYEKILPNVTKNIIEYNDILKRQTEYIDVSEALHKGGVIEDHHHMNEIGHKLVFNKIVEKLEKVVN